MHIFWLGMWTSICKEVLALPTVAAIPFYRYRYVCELLYSYKDPILSPEK